MEIFSTIKDTQNHLQILKNQGKTIGFVPTMGALHRGHTSLIERAKRENNIAVASIFVNPLQFNDKRDLEKYPRTLEKDAEKLKNAHCDVIFAPSAEEMYPPPHLNPPQRGGLDNASLSPLGRDGVGLDLGNLDKVMEGLHRPGHFEGVCVVVKKLLDIVQPNKAYFGEKDFQQLAIIKHMVKTLEMPVEVISCPTVIEADGLAMSSRNMLLSSDERKNAAYIYKTMQEAREKAATPTLKGEIQQPPLGRGVITVLKKWVEEKINENPFLQLEYFEIVNSETLQPVQTLDEAKNLRACIAVKVGAVRLIDNIPFS